MAPPPVGATPVHELKGQTAIAELARYFKNGRAFVGKSQDRSRVDIVVAYFRAMATREEMAQLSGGVDSSGGFAGMALVKAKELHDLICDLLVGYYKERGAKASTYEPLSKHATMKASTLENRLSQLGRLASPLDKPPCLPTEGSFKAWRDAKAEATAQAVAKRREEEEEREASRKRRREEHASGGAAGWTFLSIGKKFLGGGSK